MPGTIEVRSTVFLNAMDSMCACCLASSLLSNWAASIISDMNIDTAMSSIGSLVPDTPTPLSSDASIFFIQSSEEEVDGCSPLPFPIEDSPGDTDVFRPSF